MRLGQSISYAKVTSGLRRPRPERRIAISAPLSTAPAQNLGLTIRVGPLTDGQSALVQAGGDELLVGLVHQKARIEYLRQKNMPPPSDDSAGSIMHQVASVPDELGTHTMTYSFAPHPGCPGKDQAASQAYLNWLRQDVHSPFAAAQVWLHGGPKSPPGKPPFEQKGDCFSSVVAGDMELRLGSRLTDVPGGWKVKVELARDLHPPPSGPPVRTFRYVAQTPMHLAANPEYQLDLKKALTTGPAPAFHSIKSIEPECIGPNQKYKGNLIVIGITPADPEQPQRRLASDIALEVQTSDGTSLTVKLRSAPVSSPPGTKRGRYGDPPPVPVPVPAPAPATAAKPPTPSGPSSPRGEALDSDFDLGMDSSDLDTPALSEGSNTDSDMDFDVEDRNREIREDALNQVAQAQAQHERDKAALQDAEAALQTQLAELMAGLPTKEDDRRAAISERVSQKLARESHRPGIGGGLRTMLPEVMKRYFSDPQSYHPVLGELTVLALDPDQLCAFYTAHVCSLRAAAQSLSPTKNKHQAPAGPSGDAEGLRRSARLHEKQRSGSSGVSGGGGLGSAFDPQVPLKKPKPKVHMNTGLFTE